MPRTARWFVKAAMVYLVVALALGMTLSLQGLVPLPPYIAASGPIYFHLFMVGWVTQLIFGVAYWMFPKYSKQLPRGHEELALGSLGLLNVGLLMRAVAEPLHALHPTTIWGWLLVLSALLQWLAGVGFLVNTWPRVKQR